MIYKTCLYCKNIYSVSPYRKDKTKYCSMNCFHKSRIGKETIFKKGHPFGLRFGGGQKSYQVKKGEHMNPNTEFKKGHIPVNKGIHQWFICKRCHTKFYPKDQVKRTYCSNNCYLTSVLKNPEVIEKRAKKLRGQTRTGECKKRLSEQKMGIKNPMFGKKMTREQIRKFLRRRPMSYLEVKTQNVIDKYKLPYKFVGNGKFFIERKNPDFININGKKTAVEVYSKKQKDRFKIGGTDGWRKERTDIFNKYGWKILFLEQKDMSEFYILNTLKGGD